MKLGQVRLDQNRLYHVRFDLIYAGFPLQRIRTTLLCDGLNFLNRHQNCWNRHTRTASLHQQPTSLDGIAQHRREERRRRTPTIALA